MDNVSIYRYGSDDLGYRYFDLARLLETHQYIDCSHCTMNCIIIDMPTCCEIEEITVICCCNEWNGNASWDTALPWNWHEFVIHEINAASNKKNYYALLYWWEDEEHAICSRRVWGNCCLRIFCWQENQLQGIKLCAFHVCGRRAQGFGTYASAYTLLLL